MTDMNQIPDFVWEALHNYSLRQSDEFLHWLNKNEQHRQLFEELCDVQEAADRLLSEDEPNVELQWKRVGRMKAKKQLFFQRNAFQSCIIGIAASLLIIFLFQLYDRQKNKLEENIIPEWIVANVPVKKDSPIAIKSVRQECPIILTTEKGETRAIHKKVLDYTRKDTTLLAVQKQTLTTPRGKSIKIRLSDSTEVWLNAESRLSYPSHFTDAARTIELEGEAYFKVAHDSIRPFIVKHNNITTQALGTEFNIRAYTDATQHVTLVNGSVRVSNLLSEQKEVLSPGQDAECDTQQSKIEIKEVNTRNFTAWTENLFYFENEELLNIMQAIGRWYNITVIFENELLQHYHFTFWADRNSSLKENLSLLNQIGTITAYLDIKQNRIVIRK